MLTDVYTSFSAKRTPQNAPAKPSQAKNNAGGFTFVVDDFTKLHRFLTIGSTGGTFYVSAPELTRKCANDLLRLVEKEPFAVVDAVVDVSLNGRAPKQDPALFVLAMVSGCANQEGRAYALSKLSDVARTGTHLFKFVKYAEQFRGWGRGLRRAVADWYSGSEPERIVYQALKYKQREGWSHRDLLRLSHPSSPTVAHREVYDWICRGEVGETLPPLAAAARLAVTPDADVSELIRQGHGLSWEMLPSDALNRPDVWAALLEQGLPQGALLRQLPRLTRLGLCDPLTELGSKTLPLIVDQLTDPRRLAKARIHPVAVLTAAKTYQAGRSLGGREWNASAQVANALDEAFYAAYGGVEPTGKRTLLALDVSGSMVAPAGGLPISCREVSAALALVTARVEPAHTIVGFTGSSDGLEHLGIRPGMSLSDAVAAVSGLTFGFTDCSLPMQWALANGKQVDTFVVYTDNETWVGGIHPHQALAQYRRETGINARLVVVALTPTEFSIADPDDLGMLDVSGFDASVPALISGFSSGVLTSGRVGS